MSPALTDFFKQDNKVLRDLVVQAYRAELGAELDKLLAEFHRWKAGEIEPGDLAYAIHQFHDGPNRDLFKLYNSQDLRLIVARAVALRLLEPSSVPSQVLADLESLIDYARQQFD